MEEGEQSGLNRGLPSEMITYKSTARISCTKSHRIHTHKGGLQITNCREWMMTLRSLP